MLYLQAHHHYINPLSCNFYHHQFKATHPCLGSVLYTTISLDFVQNMARLGIVLVVALCLTISVLPDTTTAQLSHGFYSKTCPNVEQIVRNVVQNKVKQTFVTISATLRLFFHDCFVNVCFKFKRFHIFFSSFVKRLISFLVLHSVYWHCRVVMPLS